MMKQIVAGGSGAKKAAREQAAATREAAEAEAKRARLSAQAAQMQQESMINRQRAGDAARALQENQLNQEVDIEQVAANEVEADVDETTFRRRAPRDAYRTRRAGIQI